MTTLSLRPYQSEAISAVLLAHVRGVQRPLIALPTGSGKTVVFAHLASMRGGRTLILAHRDELIQQAAEKLMLVDPRLEIGIVKASQDEHDCPVVVASVQTLSRPKRLDRLIPDFDTIIIDEAHHALAQSYQRILQHCKSFDTKGPLTVGVTATPERGDHESLGEVFQEIVYEKRIIDLIPDYLCDLRAMQILLGVDFRQLHTRAGDVIDREVEQMLLAADAPTQVARAYQEYAMGRKTIIFTPTVKTAYAMVEAFEHEGRIPIEALDATTPIDKRRAILNRFHHGDVMVLANCGILTEGYDEPSVNAIVIARPTKSKVLYAQMIGRACRHYPGKTDGLIMDVVGVTNRFDLITFAGLFDIEEKRLKGKSLRQALDEREVEIAEAEAFKEHQGQLVARIIDLFGKRSMHWVEAGGSRFAMSTFEGVVYLEPMVGLENRWSVRFKTRHGGHVTLRDHLDLGYAQGFAEDYVREQGASPLTNPQAAWRTTPAAEEQLNVLRRARIPFAANITKGEASDMIAAATLDWN